MSLREKSNAEFRRLLTYYGIKHGPILASTRNVYERKLQEAMANDRTFYREEEEEITYIIHRHPMKRKTSTNSGSTSGTILKVQDQDQNQNQDQNQSQDQDKDQKQDQNQDQDQDAADKVPFSSTDQEGSTELYEDNQLDQVHLAPVTVRRRRTSYHAEETTRPSRWRSEGKAWMLIPAVLLLTAAGCYYTLSAGM